MQRVPVQFAGSFSRLAWVVLVCVFLVSRNALGNERENVRADEVKPLHSQKGGWRLVQQLSDEFGGGMLDTAKWDNDVKDWGVWSWEPENVWVSNGNLNLRMDYSEHRRGQWTL